MDRLDTIVEQLESDELSLEETMTAYQEAVGLAKEGRARLEDAERRIEEVSQKGQATPVDPEIEADL